MGVSVKVEGLRDLEAELDKLTTAAGKGALRRAGRKSAEPLAELMRQGAPRDEGDLEASIGVSTKLAHANANCTARRSGMTNRRSRSLWAPVHCRKRT
mgnify:CR=1 FL=1